MNDKIIFNWMLEFKRKEINPRERAIIMDDYLKRNNLTHRQLAEELVMPHSTVTDWLLWSKISEENYKELKDMKYNDTDIYRILRSGKKLNKRNELNDLNILLIHTNNKLKKFINNRELTPNTQDYANELINTLNRILIKKKSDK